MTECTHDLSATKNTIPEPILFADDASLVILSKNIDELCTTVILLLPHVNECSAATEYPKFRCNKHNGIYIK
jgi:hypothetical protein